MLLQPHHANRAKLAYRHDDSDPELNADLSQRALAPLADMAWEASPQPGVERKRLEVIGTALPRLTTLVRFAPGSRFPEHGHDGGEEFIVLEGTFSDHTGHYGAGSYVRNPVGFCHAPFTDEGCTIFVKLRQHSPDDCTRVTIDTTQADWPAANRFGHACLDLHAHGPERVRLLRMRSACEPLTLTDPGGIELLLLDGEASSDGGTLKASSWLRLPAGEHLQLSSGAGCLFYLKTGHLVDSTFFGTTP